MIYCNTLPKVTPPCKHSASRVLFFLNPEMFFLCSLASPRQHSSGDCWFHDTPSSVKEVSQAQNEKLPEVSQLFFFFPPSSVISSCISESPGRSTGWLDLNITCAVTALSISLQNRPQPACHCYHSRTQMFSKRKKQE